jgi:hypothetical protein
MDRFQKFYLIFLAVFLPFSIILYTLFPFTWVIGETTYQFFIVAGYNPTADIIGWAVFGSLCGLDVYLIREVFT